jgi:deazaflavin-dependent oxidoreductase (nitroreductase family)
MPYVRPPLFVRNVFNPLAMRFGIGGAAALTVKGRRTGTPRSVPVITVSVDGSEYIVSPRGETQWARNLRVAGRGELGRGAAKRSFSATEVGIEERPPILAAYQAKAGRAVASFFRALPDPADHPVFRIEP